MKFYKSLFLTLTIALFFAANSYAQDVSSTFKIAYPELYGELKIEEGTKYDKNLKDKYRDAFYKLKTGADEVRQYELGVLIAENMTVFDNKSIKKLERENKLDSLKNYIQEHMDEISALMWGKEKFGADSIRAIEKYIPYKDAYKAKNLDEAYKYWTIIFKEFPIFHSSVYSGGAKIISHKIDNAKDSVEKFIWVDTLMMVYDQAIKFYPKNKYYYLGAKAVDYYDFYLGDADLNTDTSKYFMGVNYDMLSEAIELGGTKTNLKAFFYAMKLTAFRFMAGELDTATVVDNYMNYSSVLGEMIKVTNNNEKYSQEKKDKKNGYTQKIINIVDQIFFSLEDVSSCEVMINAFTPKFEENPQDVELLKKILAVLAKKKCTDSELFEKAAVALYDLEPSAESAGRLAGLYITKENYESALKYYDEAISQETVDTVKANYYFDAAKVLKELNQFSKSREYCYNAADLKPGFGEPYLLVASLYAASAGSCGGDAVEVGIVFCLAVDKCIKAKSEDPSLAEQANSLIGTYSGRYPKFADAFQHNPPINEGQSYTVGCWIGETTTVRVIK